MFSCLKPQRPCNFRICGSNVNARTSPSRTSLSSSTKNAIAQIPFNAVAEISEKIQILESQLVKSFIGRQVQFPESPFAACVTPDERSVGPRFVNTARAAA